MNKLVVLLFIVTIVSCDVKPQAIAYGEDACHFCRMTIVDRQHSAELVTVKGKVYKYVYAQNSRTVSSCTYCGVSDFCMISRTTRRLRLTHRSGAGRNRR